MTIYDEKHHVTLSQIVILLLYSAFVAVQIFQRLYFPYECFFWVSNTTTAAWMKKLVSPKLSLLDSLDLNTAW